MPRRTSSATVGRTTVVHQALRTEPSSTAGTGRIGAHAAGVRTRVAVEGPLVVLGREPGAGSARPLTMERSETSSPSRNSSTSTVSAAVAEAPLHEALGQSRLGLLQRRGRR